MENEQQETSTGGADSPGISQGEKACRWDLLIGMLKAPQMRDTGVRHLSSQRRAVLMLLSSREELPESLTAELKSYMVMLDELYLEAIDGFEELEGVLNFFPTYITASVAGELCQPDSTDDV